MTILSGMLAFDIMDHVMGDWTVLNEQWFEDMGERILGTTTLWFWMNIVCGHSQQRRRRRRRKPHWQSLTQARLLRDC